MTISVTGYDAKGQARVYGRNIRDAKEVPGDAGEALAEENARRYAENFVSRYPDTGPIEKWTFKRDACDRQLFKPAR